MPLHVSVRSGRPGVPGLVWAFALLVSCLTPIEARAFKVETHVWIAQQLIDELSVKPEVTVRLGTLPLMLPVLPRVRDAILAHPELFRLGSIGPDAFPGVYEGQMTIHPGAEKKGWGTGEWLTHVLRLAETPPEIAFAYGFLVHAAADIFAHTYVNHYAGDIYLLADGEIDVETRHFLLEGYIAQRMPSAFKPGPVPAAGVTDALRKSGALAVPTTFLRKVFVDHEDAARQFSANGSSHLGAVHDLNVALTEATRKGGPLDKAHVLSQQLFVYYYTGYTVNEKQVKQFNQAHQRLRDMTNDGIDQLQEAHDQFRGLATQGLGAAHQAEADALSRAQDLVLQIKKLNDDKGKVERDLAKALDDLHKLVDPISFIDENICRNVIDVPCAFTDPFGVEHPIGCGVIRQVCEIVRRTVTTLHELRPTLTDLVSAKQNAKGQVLSQISNALNDYKAAVNQVHTTTNSILVAEGQLLRGAVDFLQRFSKDVDPITSLLIGWLDDNNAAMEAYFLANATAIAHAIDSGPVMEPLEYWAKCSAPVLLGIPSQVVGGTCIVKATVDDIKKALDTLEDLAAKQDPILKEVMKAKKEINRIFEIAKREALVSMASTITGTNVKTLMEILKSKPTKQMVDDEFSRPVKAKSLVRFDKVSDRVDREMVLDANGRFSPEHFNVVYNAVVLSKLALLDADALNLLMKKKVFAAKPLERSNLLLRFARSIDGNHQWLQKPPPYPRSNQQHGCGDPYGYPPNFVLWTDNATRKRVFNGLFKGPLSPGLEIPATLGLPPALPEGYPYRPSVANPFPNYLSTCK
jgi:hypothetical protein